MCQAAHLSRAPAHRGGEKPEKIAAAQGVRSAEADAAAHLGLTHIFHPSSGVQEDARDDMWVNTPQSIRELSQAFLLQKQVGGCSAKTVRVYTFWLDRLVAAIPAVDALDPLTLTRFFAQLRERHLKPTTVHRAYRVLRTFFHLRGDDTSQGLANRRLVQILWANHLCPKSVPAAVGREPS